MASDQSEKSRIMNRCLETIPRHWFIADKCFQRIGVLGKGSWAFAFKAKRIDPCSRRSGGSLELNSTLDIANSTSDNGETMIPVNQIAVKAIVKKAHTKKSMEKYPKREVEIMNKLNGHQHVIKLYYHWQDEQCFYLAMELCPNKSLSNIIKSKDYNMVLSSEQIVHYQQEMLLGCQFMEKNLVVHRDLKPDNVLLDSANHIKISDFGLSVNLSFSSELLYTVCGTPKYTAPEMIRKIGYSFPIDIWAVGCILFRLHYQVPPFDGQESSEIYNKLLNGHIYYRRINRFHRPMLPDDLSTLRSMLKKNPKLRGTVETLLHSTNNRLSGKCDVTKSRPKRQIRRTSYFYY
ncbi:hypothetical protein RDWZM_006155 [Blomia tropicalis]|uniref:Protein kinase domain-containing protein n=1 Tax=Blomia tropicalis TaxID=40697 RepID=A0A9Q0RLH7_BLOTA|nr:hypothetical protein RDWZM_006155 [Blomia tropicalis]